MASNTESQCCAMLREIEISEHPSHQSSGTSEDEEAERFYEPEVGMTWRKQRPPNNPRQLWIHGTCDSTQNTCPSLGAGKTPLCRTVSTPARNIFLMDSCSRRGKTLSSMKWYLAIRYTAGLSPHSGGVRANVNWTPLFESGEVGRLGGLRELGNGKDYDQSIVNKVLQE